MKTHSELTTTSSIKQKFGGLALLTLLLALFSLTTTNQAHAADTIQKGVMAMDQGGNPAANVKFALWLSYADGSSSHMSEVVTTPADGKAIITIPKADYSSVEIMMQPPSNMGSIRNPPVLTDVARSENLDFQFAFLVKPASAILSIKNPGGSVAAPGTVIAFKESPAQDSNYVNLRVIDPTQFGLGIGGGGQVASSPAWVTGETYGMDFWPAAGFDCNNLASRSYGFTFNGASPRQVSFINTDGTIVTPVNGVVTLTLDSPKVMGKLLKHDGTAPLMKFLKTVVR